MRSKITLVLLFIISLFFGCSDFASSDKTLAIINGKKISYKQFQERISKMPPYYQTISISHPRQLLDDIITEQVLYEEAVRKGLQNDKYIKEVFQEAKKKILITGLLEEEAKKKIKVEPDQIKDYYDTHIQDFTVPEKINVYHILVNNEQQARELLERLENGEDFANLAMQFSTDSSKERRGDLGFFKRGQMLPELESICFALEENQLSDIVKTKFGYHIIKINKKIPAHPQQFGDVSDKIKMLLIDQKQKERINEFIKTLRGKSNIVINDDLLKQLESEQESFKEK